MHGFLHLKDKILKKKNPIFKRFGIEQRRHTQLLAQILCLGFVKVTDTIHPKFSPAWLAESRPETAPQHCAFELKTQKICDKSCN